MIGAASATIVLRFRDLVTELGGTIAEHRRIMRYQGHAWWGWWRRQSEHVPKGAMAGLFAAGSKRNEVAMILFDSGTLRLYGTLASQVVVSPTAGGIQSPAFEATPEYYVRGQYPLWFRLEGDIVPLAESTVEVIGTPTTSAAADVLPDEPASAHSMSLEQLRDDRPTLWLARRIDSSMPAPQGEQGR